MSAGDEMSSEAIQGHVKREVIQGCHWAVIWAKEGVARGRRPGCGIRNEANK